MAKDTWEGGQPWAGDVLELSGRWRRIPVRTPEHNLRRRFKMSFSMSPSQLTMYYIHIKVNFGSQFWAREMLSLTRLNVQ